MCVLRYFAGPIAHRISPIGMMWASVSIASVGLFLLASGMIGLGLALMLSHRHSPAVCVGIGAMPFVVTALYIFGLRQGKPKSFDTDLLETLLSGNGWMAPVKQPRNPLLHAGS